MVEDFEITRHTSPWQSQSAGLDFVDIHSDSQALPAIQSQSPQESLSTYFTGLDSLSSAGSSGLVPRSSIDGAIVGFAKSADNSVKGAQTLDLSSTPDCGADSSAHLQAGISAIAAGAFFGGALSSWQHGNDMRFADPERRALMNWWAPSSKALKSVEPLNKTLADAKLEVQLTKWAAEDHRSLLGRAAASMEQLHRSTSSELLEALQVQKAAEIIKRQKAYIESPIDLKDLLPGESAGTVSELASGEKLFEKGTTLAKAVEKFETATAEFKLNEGWVRRNRILDILKSMHNELGDKVNLTSADIDLIERKNLFTDLVRRNPTLAETQIGSEAEVKAGSKLFLKGSEAANVLADYAGTAAEQTSLDLSVEAAASGRLAAEDAFASGMKSAAGSWGANVLRGAGKGMLIAGAAVAAAYGVERVCDFISQKQK